MCTEWILTWRLSGEWLGVMWLLYKYMCFYMFFFIREIVCVEDWRKLLNQLGCFGSYNLFIFDDSPSHSSHNSLSPY